MRYLTADYIFPVSSEPIKNGVIAMDDFGEIKQVGTLSEIKNPKSPVETFEGIICPGFINTHCHLELSFLKDKLTPNTRLAGFIAQVLRNRFAFSKDVMLKAIAEGEQEMIKNGIVAVGDISNNDSTFAQKAENNLMYHTFLEVLELVAFRAEETMTNVRRLKREARGLNLESSIVPHAPYTLSEKLLKLINEDAKKNKGIISIHNQESEAENELFVSKSGELFDLFRTMGISYNDLRHTEKRSAQSTLRYLKDAAKILLVHNTFTDKEDIRWIKTEIRSEKCEVYFCTCPNANMFIENKLPDYNLFIDEKLDVTIGTDSLASNWSLSILDEMKTISQHFPEIPLQTLLIWATKNGAEFFDYEELGTIEKGKTPGLNLLKNVDGMKITKNTVVEKLI